MSKKFASQRINLEKYKVKFEQYKGKTYKNKSEVVSIISSGGKIKLKLIPFEY